MRLPWVARGSVPHGIPRKKKDVHHNLEFVLSNMNEKEEEKSHSFPFGVTEMAKQRYNYIERNAREK